MKVLCGEINVGDIIYHQEKEYTITKTGIASIPYDGKLHVFETREGKTIGYWAAKEGVREHDELVERVFPK